MRRAINTTTCFPNEGDVFIPLADRSHKWLNRGGEHGSGILAELSVKQHRWTRANRPRLSMRMAPCRGRQVLRQVFSAVIYPTVTVVEEGHPTMLKKSGQMRK